MDVNSLAHTKWNCKYHVVFAPKFRRKIIYNQLRADIGKIIRMLCERKDITIIEAELCPDHVHMLISIPPKMSVSGAILCRYSRKKYKSNTRVYSKSIKRG